MGGEGLSECVGLAPDSIQEEAIFVGVLSVGIQLVAQFLHAIESNAQFVVERRSHAGQYARSPSDCHWQQRPS